MRQFQLKRFTFFLSKQYISLLEITDHLKQALNTIIIINLLAVSFQG